MKLRLLIALALALVLTAALTLTAFAEDALVIEDAPIIEDGLGIEDTLIIEDALTDSEIDLTLDDTVGLLPDDIASEQETTANGVEGNGMLPEEMLAQTNGTVGNGNIDCYDWEALTYALWYANNGDTIYLSRHIEQGETHAAVSGKSVTLDLNFMPITGKGDCEMLRISSNARLYLTGNGIIEDCGTAVIVGEHCAFTMDCVTSDVYRTIYKSTGIGVDNSGDFTMNGGIIADGYNYGVYNNGSFTMADGEITGNKGRGVYSEFGSFTMTGGCIQKNKFGVAAGPNVKTVLTVSGYPLITGNTEADVLVHKGQVINLGGKLNKGAQIGITLSSDNLPGPGKPVVVTRGLKGNGTAENFMVWGNYEARINADGELEVSLKVAPTAAPDATLLAKLSVCGKKALHLSWTAVDGAQGYDVFFGKCGNGSLKKVTSITKGLSCSFKGLKKGKTYRACVKAWTRAGGNKSYIGEASPTVYAIAGGYSETRCNPESVTVKKTRLSLRVGKTAKISAKVKGVKSHRKVLQKVSLVRYYSSNSNVAKVSSSGKVTGVGVGSCKVWVVANNGVRKSVEVVVGN